MKIVNLIQQYEDRQARNINLVSSENIISKNARHALKSDLAHRYIIPPEKERPKTIWEYPNQKILRHIEKTTKIYAKNIYHGEYADVRPLSGNNVVYIIFKSLVPNGGTIFRIPANCGGHFATPIICQSENIKLIDIPYKIEKEEIDIEKLKELYNIHKPQLLFLDASMILFPHPIKEIRKALGNEIVISYDASQVFGLIGGNRFQSPLEEGADIIHGSVHKSLFGPQKGMIVCKDNAEIASKIQNTVTPLFVSNSHPHHVAALGIALEEVMEFGESYAHQTVKNAKILAQYLDSKRFNISGKRKGFTESHQIFIRIGEKKDALEVFLDLEEIGINSNLILVPFSNKYGLRLGTAEITRKGFKEDDVMQIGELIVSCIKEGKSKEKLSQEVSIISKKFTEVHYC